MEVNQVGEAFCLLDCLSFEKAPLKNTIVVTITFIAIGILLGAAIGALASIPLGGPMVLGFACGAFLAISLFFYNLFSMEVKEIPCSNLETKLSNPLDEIKIQIARKKTYDSFPGHFPPDILKLFFSSPTFSLNTLRALACVSKDWNKLIHNLNQERVKKVASIIKFIGWEAWEKFGWKFEDEDNKFPLIFPDIVEKLSKKSPIIWTILYIPERANVKKIGELGAKHLPKKNNCPKKSGFFMELGLTSSKIFRLNSVGRSYFAVISKAVIDGSLNKNFEKHCKKVKSLSKEDNIKYRFPKLVEVVSMVYLFKFAFKEELLSSTVTRTFEPQYGCPLRAGAVNQRGMHIAEDDRNRPTMEHQGILAVWCTE
ncbi:MAG: hypothetical protein H0T62_00650 [Parachlamydiaceae bacterium]|nr:hypothetical protein [Parachlamydiaceae bacterium]